MHTLRIAALLALATTVAEASSGHPMAGVPTGGKVARTTFTTVDEPTAASVFTPGGARTIYDRVVAEIKDPALLEWTSDGRVKLSVFPVRRDARATVTIALTTIDETGLHVDRETSLMAAPGQREERFAYGDYWPAHHTEVTVASIE